MSTTTAAIRRDGSSTVRCCRSNGSPTPRTLRHRQAGLRKAGWRHWVAPTRTDGTVIPATPTATAAIATRSAPWQVRTPRPVGARSTPGCRIPRSICTALLSNLDQGRRLRVRHSGPPSPACWTAASDTRAKRRGWATASSVPELSGPEPVVPAHVGAAPWDQLPLVPWTVRSGQAACLASGYDRTGHRRGEARWEFLRYPMHRVDLAPSSSILAAVAKAATSAQLEASTTARDR
jgi:hypothetical protein